MTPRKKIQPTTADSPLPKDLTRLFTESLNSLLTEDGSVKALYLSNVILSKYNSDDTGAGESRRLAAIQKWLLTEERNAVTNDRLRRWGESQAVYVLPGISAKRFFGKVRSVIAGVLPWTPSLDIHYGGFSGGASTSKSRRRSHPATKFLDKADITRESYYLFRDIVRGSMWDQHLNTPGLEPRFALGNVMFTVPKSSVIDRCACKEPDLNMFLQKSFGNQIRKLLRRSGIDLNDQTINQELARKGSISNSLMTIDLSSASDSVTTELVRLVLPEDWFHYLNLVRSPVTEIDGNIHVNEMFSSMGNGFTFELESLLFYAICRSVAYFGGYRGKISVYGDDIIAPSLMADDLIAALHFCGFVTNPDKSFWDGPFRESCGAHWHGGLDISPFYIKGPFRTVSDLILTLNQLIEWSSREIGVVDPRYESLIMEMAVKYVPQPLWGGSDLTSRVSLVTGDPPRYELYYPAQEKDLLHVGAYLLWLFSTLERDVEGCLHVTSSKQPGWARLRRRDRRKSISYKIYANGGNKPPTGRIRTYTDEEPHCYDVPVFLSRYSLNVEA